MENLDTQMMIRCKTEDREAVKRLSKALSLSESNIARAAFRMGLKTLRRRGIQPERRPAAS